MSRGSWFCGQRESRVGQGAGPDFFFSRFSFFSPMGWAEIIELGLGLGLSFFFFKILACEPSPAIDPSWRARVDPDPGSFIILF